MGCLAATRLSVATACGVRVGWSRSDVNLIVQCHDVTAPHSFPNELHTGPKTQIRPVFAGRGSVVICTARFPRWFISRELALVSPPAAEILTPLQAVTLKLFITPGVFKVTGWKKLHFEGEKHVFLRTNGFIFLRQFRK